MEQNVSPRNRGSRPTITLAPDGFCPLTYRAIPVTARRTLANVNSSATIARHPEVPNLICAGMVQFDVRIVQSVPSICNEEFNDFIQAVHRVQPSTTESGTSSLVRTAAHK